MVCYPTDLSPESIGIRSRIHADSMAAISAHQDCQHRRAMAMAAILERRVARGEVITPESEARWEVPPRSLTQAQRKSLRYETWPTRQEQEVEDHRTLGHMPRMRLVVAWREDGDPPGAIRVHLETLPPCERWSRDLLVEANGETRSIS